MAGPVLSRIEPELAVILEHAGAAPDDLLELDHRVGEAHEHDLQQMRSSMLVVSSCELVRMTGVRVSTSCSAME